MKRLFVLLISISMVAYLYAVPSKKYKLVVKTTNSEYSYALYKQPEISFTNTDMVIKMDQEDVRFAKSDILEFLFDYNQYMVTFLDWDGDTLQSSMVNYGEVPTYTGVTPTRESDAQYTYTFTGWWSPELSMVTGTANYYAQYDATLNQYEINFYDWDGTLLQSNMVNYGELPTYYNSDPWRESDAQYTYTFSGWSPELDMVTSHQSYYAQYETMLNQYEVTFYDWNGIVLQSSWYYYNEMPEYVGETPTRPEDVKYTYTFLTWNPEIVSVIENAAYTAIYEAVEKVGTSTENITADTIKPRKVYIDGHLYIIIGKHVYSCQGLRIK